MRARNCACLLVLVLTAAAGCGPKDVPGKASGGSAADVAAGIQMDDSVLTPDLPFAFCVKLTNRSAWTAYVPVSSLLYTAAVWFQEVSNDDGRPKGEPVRLLTNFGSVLMGDEAVAIPLGESRHGALIVAAPPDDLPAGRVYEVWLELAYGNIAPTTVKGRPGRLLRDEEVWRGKLTTNHLRGYLQPEPGALVRRKQEIRDKLGLPADVDGWKLRKFIYAALESRPVEPYGRFGQEFRLAMYEDPRFGKDEDLAAGSWSGLCGAVVERRARRVELDSRAARGDGWPTRFKPIGPAPEARERARRLLEGFLARRPESVFAPLERERLAEIGKR